MMLEPIAASHQSSAASRFLVDCLLQICNWVLLLVYGNEDSVGPDIDGIHDDDDVSDDNGGAGAVGNGIDNGAGDQDRTMITLILVVK